MTTFSNVVRASAGPGIVGIDGGSQFFVMSSGCLSYRVYHLTQRKDCVKMISRSMQFRHCDALQNYNYCHFFTFCCGIVHDCICP